MPHSGTVAVLVFTMADLGVHDGRSSRSRWTDLGVHDGRNTHSGGGSLESCALPPGRPTEQRSHRQIHSRLVDEDEAAGFEVEDRSSELLTLLDDVRPVLLTGDESLFFSDSPVFLRARTIADLLIEIFLCATQVSFSCSLVQSARPSSTKARSSSRSSAGTRAIGPLRTYVTPRSPVSRHCRTQRRDEATPTPKRTESSL